MRRPPAAQTIKIVGFYSVSEQPSDFALKSNKLVFLLDCSHIRDMEQVVLRLEKLII